MQIAKTIEPTEYILSILSKQERLEITFKIAQEAFKQTTLILEDIESAVKRTMTEIDGWYIFCLASKYRP